MPGPENHSKKPKAVTIDLTANADAETSPISERTMPGAREVETETATAVETKPADNAAAKSGRFEAETPTGPVSRGADASGGFTGKLGAGILGGLIALGGGVGMQASGYLPSFGGTSDLAALKAQVEQVASALKTPAIDPATLLALKDAQSALAQKVDGLTAGDPAVLAAMQDKIAALETALTNGAGGVVADPAQTQAITVLTEKVAALEAKPSSGNGSGAVALAIAASGLKAAIDRGGPFMSELETYAGVANASPDVEALRALAASGVPSRQDLVTEFFDVANAMIAASRTSNPDAGVFEKLADSAKNLVKARPVGDIAGDAPDAVVARMEVNLGRGNLDTVLSEAAKLPDAAKTAWAAFLDKVKARRDTDALVSKALTLALAAAGGKS
jgi:hypothetical protein